MRKILYILLLLCVPLFGGAQEQYVDTVFHDNIDRTANDFVIASLVVADPGSVLYSVLGHAAIRLQCPAYGMDYCFSYESEDVRHKVLQFLAGKLKMGLFAIPIDEYCAPYRAEGRGVYEYTLNLPIEAKRELWRILDEELVKGTIPYDYYHRGCAITCVRFVEQALGDIAIHYPSYLYEKPKSARESLILHTKDAQWMRFIILYIAGSETQTPLTGAEQLIVPSDLAYAWQHSSIEGHPLLSAEPTILVTGEPQKADCLFTPMALAILLLIVAIANLFWAKPYLDWMFLALQTFLGSGLSYLVFLSDLCCTEWHWLLIPFNLLPLLFWHWRRYWALPYAIVLLIWSIGMLIVPNLSEDAASIVLTLALAMVFAKQSPYIQNHWFVKSSTPIQ